MTIYTGTAYIFRATPTPGPEFDKYLEMARTLNARHKYSHGFIGKKVRDLDGESAFSVCGFGYLPNLDAAKSYVDEMSAEGVYTLGEKSHTDYQSTVYWPSQIPNSEILYDPDRKKFEQGAFIVVRNTPDMSAMAKMGPYIQALKKLYDRYEYDLIYTGQRAFDQVGETAQQTISIGRFPTVEQAVACHEDPEYQEVRRLRDDLLLGFEAALYGPLE